MKKFKLVLFITIFTLFIGINSVSAKESIGACDYVNVNKNTDTVTVYLYDNNTATIRRSGFDIDLTGVYLQHFVNGTCYQYMGILSRVGSVTPSFSDESYENLQGEQYQLSNGGPALNCYYDIHGFNDGSADTYLRIKVEKKKDGSRFYTSAMGFSENFTTLNTMDGDYRNFFTATRVADNQIEYDLRNSSNISTKIKFSFMIDNFRKFETTCPALYYTKYNNSGEQYIVLGEGSTDYATSNNSYKVKTDTSSGTETRVDDSTSEGDTGSRLCGFNGTYTMDTGKRFSFNLTLEKDSVGYKWCLEIDSKKCKYVYDRNNPAIDGLNSQLEVSINNSTFETRYFGIYEDLQTEFKNIIDGTQTTCPGQVYIRVAGLDTNRYMFTLDSEFGTRLDNGINLNPGGTSQLKPVDKGITEYECSDLIGPNVLKFLEVIFNLIRIIGPIIALLLGMYDLFMAMVNGEDDAKKKAMKKLKGRIIAAVLLLILPYILDILLNLINKTGSNCIPH